MTNIIQNPIEPQSIDPIQNKDPQIGNPILSLPPDIVYEILEKIPASVLDCSNPFSILENCSFANPSSSTLISINRIAAHPNLGLNTKKTGTPETVISSPVSGTLSLNPTKIISTPFPLPLPHIYGIPNPYLAANGNSSQLTFLASSNCPSASS